ncbi:MAG TPA: ABC transporter permease subunit [Dermatophilaceae bacterium]|nr:ABC transporter permease subunit [Dermatophilaceae bacterium]
MRKALCDSGFPRADPTRQADAQHVPTLAGAPVSPSPPSRRSLVSMLDILGEDFIRMARSQGLGERRVTIRQTLRAAMTPVATQLGIDVGTLTGRAP